MEAWREDVAPSDTLRRWFNHDPAKWTEFRRRYFAELNRHRDALQPILDAVTLGNVTLLYSSHDTEHNNAVALTEHLASRLDRWNCRDIARRHPAIQRIEGVV
jgi:uncharacterized protein YeaO (DUF488 family)